MEISLGIDIGSRYTKVVELEYRPAPQLINNIIFRTPFLPREQLGPEQLDTQAFWQRITKYIPLERIKASRVAISLPSGSVTALTLLVPRMSKHELNTVAQTEARRRMIPASGPNHIFESFYIGERIVNKLPRSEALAVRTEKIHVQRMLDLLKEIDVIPRIIAHSSCVHFTIFPQEVLNKKEQDTAFVDIGLTSINTSIFKEGKLNFFRNTAFGLQDIIQDISSHLSITDNEAEDIIKEQGVPEVNVDLKDKVAVAEEIMKQKYEASLKVGETNQKEEINLLELRVLWQSHIERIIHELRRSLAYYKEQAEGRRVEYIYFLGGGCQVKNLIGLITEQIGGQWQIILPFKNMLLPKEKNSVDQSDSTPIFANAVSFSLSVSSKVKGAGIVNFLPVELKKREFIATRRLIIRFLKIALIFSLSLLSISTFFTNRSLRVSVKAIELELKGVRKIANKLKDLTRQEEKSKQETSRIGELLKKRKNFSPILAKLSASIPEEVLVTFISIDDAMASETQGQAAQAADGQAVSQQYKIQIKAEVFADYEKANKIIDNFRSNLEGAVYFRNINFTAIKLEKISTVSSAGGSQELRLTQPLKRDFTVNADIAAQ